MSANASIQFKNRLNQRTKTEPKSDVVKRFFRSTAALMDALLPGTEVFARGLRWELVLTQAMGEQTLCRLRGLEGAVLGKEYDFLSPFEEIKPTAKKFEPEHAAPLSDWLVYHQAFLLEQALGSDALSAIQPGRLQVEPYQLVPVHRAIRMSRPRLMIADGVGLGKTVETGVTLTELIARRIAHRILIVTPAGPLQDQWLMEMNQRFGLRLEILDRGRLDEIRRGTEKGSNPFDYVSLGLASIDFLKQESVLEELEKATYDVVVVDEAHHCMISGGIADREGSKRRRLAEVLARRSDALILTTATPHDGNDRSFASLCELLDPSLVDGNGELRGERYKAHVVRRLKCHIIDPVTKQPRFQEREVLPIPVVAQKGLHAKYIELQKAILGLIAPELKKATKSRRYSDVLALISLLKRSVSTGLACRITLQAVRDRMQSVLSDKVEQQESRSQRIKTLKEMVRKQEAFGTLSAEEEAEQHALEIEEMAQTFASLQREQKDSRSESRQVSRVAKMVEALDEIIELAEAASDQDPKIDALVQEIVEIRKKEPRANILIYTEYMDSQRAVLARLKNVPEIGELLSMNGDDPQTDRLKTTERFRSADNLVLVSTDAAAEGLNLHQRCHHLIHLELPFNPNRLEQRNGRIDRFGQSLIPYVRYFYLKETFEERILLRLIAKYERQRKKLTFVPNTLGLKASEDQVAEKLLCGLIEEEGQLFQRSQPTFDFVSGDENEGSAAAARELLEEIDRTLNGYDRAVTANSWLGTEGVNAEASLFTEADLAREKGEELTTVELMGFIQDAVRLNGGDVQEEGEIVILKLPSTWGRGFEGVPGYDPEDRTFRLTTNIEILKDSADREVGFLGRAHPLVRQALDRVRHLALGSSSSIQDQRISAITAGVSEPELLFTFIGRIFSKAGREFERIFAVKVSKSGEISPITQNSKWLKDASPKNAIRTKDLWKTEFAGWGEGKEEPALKKARDAFKNIAGDFIAKRRGDLAKERDRNQEWLEQRAKEIIGDRGFTSIQIDLFGNTKSEPLKEPAAWAKLGEASARLAGFAQDRTQPATLRHEANGVITLYKKRMDQIQAHEQLREPEIVPVGMLMVVPKGGRK